MVMLLSPSGHTEIQGNEDVDALAKNGLNILFLSSEPAHTRPAQKVSDFYFFPEKPVMAGWQI
jgi:hypothetical protein